MLLDLSEWRQAKSILIKLVLQKSPQKWRYPQGWEEGATRSLGNSVFGAMRRLGSWQLDSHYVWPHGSSERPTSSELGLGGGSTPTKQMEMYSSTEMLPAYFGRSSVCAHTELILSINTTEYLLCTGFWGTKIKDIIANKPTHKQTWLCLLHLLSRTWGQCACWRAV